MADGLLSLYEATFDRRWLEGAVELADEMISQFWDEPQGCFYDTGRSHEELVVRPRDVFDNAQPCGGSVASDMLLRLSVVTGNEDYAAKAVAPLRSLAELMGRAPAGTGRWLAALDFYLSTPKEVAVIGPPDDPATSLCCERGQWSLHSPTGWSLALQARNRPRRPACRCWKGGAWWTANPQPTSARTTPASSPLPTPNRWLRNWRVKNPLSLWERVRACIPYSIRG